MARKPKPDDIPEDDDLPEEDADAAADDLLDDELSLDDEPPLDEELVEEDADSAAADLLEDELSLDDEPPLDEELVEEDAAAADLLEDDGPSLDDEPPLDDEPVEEDADAAADLLDDELSLDDEPPLDDEPAAEEDSTPPDDEEPVEDDGPPKPIPAKVSILTIFLFVLNVAAALGFAYLLTMDFQKRQSWSYYIFSHDLRILGLPLDEESQVFSGSQATRPASRIDAEQLKKEYDERKRKFAFGPDVKGLGSDSFLPVHEVIGQRITPEQLSPDVLKDLFKEVGGEPSKTLQDEVELVKKKIFPAIEATANETVKNIIASDEKRKKLAELLLPLAYTPHQIDVVNDKIMSEAKLKDADLDRALADAVQRKMLIAVLEPLEAVRPRSDADRKILENSADPDTAALEPLKKLLAQRFDEAAARPDPAKAKENSWERRSNIAYLLYTVSQLRKPDSQLLDAKAADRVEVVVGMQEYIWAAQDFTAVLTKTQDRMVRAVDADREGWSFVNKNGKIDKIGQFVYDYEKQVRQMVNLLGEIKTTETKLATLQGVKADHTKQYEERKLHYDDVVTKLIASRTETARLMVDLRQLNQQVFAADQELADAFDANQRLLEILRALENAMTKGRLKR